MKIFQNVMASRRDTSCHQKIKPRHCGGVGPLRNEEVPTNAVSVRRAGDGETPATVRERDGERNIREMDDCNTSGSAGTLSGSSSGRAALRRER
jgi:hypothetical protein